MTEQTTETLMDKEVLGFDWHLAIQQVQKHVVDWVRTESNRFKQFKYADVTDAQPLPLTACVQMKFGENGGEYSLLGLGAYAPRQIILPFNVHCYAAVAAQSSSEAVIMAQALLTHLSSNLLTLNLLVRLENGGAKQVGQLDVRLPHNQQVFLPIQTDQARYYCSFQMEMVTVFFPEHPSYVEQTQTLFE